MESSSELTHIPTGPIAKLGICKPLPDPVCKVQIATFSMGGFWASESLYGSIRGIMRTKVGYTGGSTDNPTINDLGDYIETVEMQYDPSNVSYEDLLQIFWTNCNPTKKAHKRRYSSAIHFHDSEQENLAKETMKIVEKKKAMSLFTEILPYKIFYDAEDHHQKYFLRKHKAFLESLCLSNEEIKTSYAACILNGFLGGHVSKTEKVRILDIGLSDEQTRYLEACIN